MIQPDESQGQDGVWQCALIFIFPVMLDEEQCRFESCPSTDPLYAEMDRFNTNIRGVTTDYGVEAITK